MRWTPPEKNCGACGLGTCTEFMALVSEGRKEYADCPFYGNNTVSTNNLPVKPESVQKDVDVLGRRYDFVLEPLPGEVSARKIVLPFRPDLVEKWGIKKDDIVVGRPTGAGCPVQHVLQVRDANPVTGILTCSVVGPVHSRAGEYFDVESYHIIGFEGIAVTVDKEPVFGLRQPFLPGFCMMNSVHTGVVNMVLEKSCGLHIRVEDISL